MSWGWLLLQAVGWVLIGYLITAGMAWNAVALRRWLVARRRARTGLPTLLDDALVAHRLGGPESHVAVGLLPGGAVALSSEPDLLVGAGPDQPQLRVVFEPGIADELADRLIEFAAVRDQGFVVLPRQRDGMDRSS